MTEIKTYCDHCGKLLDEKHDYPDTECGIRDYRKADFCTECLDKLETIITKFVRKGGAGNDR